MAPSGVAKHKTTKKAWKYSIIDSQESFMVHIQTITIYEETLQSIIDKYYEYNLTLQPIIIIVGEDLSNITDYYTVYNKIIYKCTSMVHAVSTCLKIHYVFNLNFQAQCKSVWEFIEQFFFEIEKPKKGPFNSFIPLLK